jgi:hypothetical protein
MSKQSQFNFQPIGPNRPIDFPIFRVWWDGNQIHGFADFWSIFILHRNLITSSTINAVANWGPSRICS